MAGDLKMLEGRSVSILKDVNSKFKNAAILWGAGKDGTTMLYLARKAFNGRIPLKVVHINNGMEFPETSKFVEGIAKKLKLDLVIVKNEAESKGKCGCDSGSMEKSLGKHGFDAVVIAITKDAKQSDCCSDDCSSKLAKGGVIMKPMLDWSEIDVWNYIKREKIPVNPLYFAKNGQRYSSVCCTSCSKQIRSDAKNVDEIIKELESSKPEGKQGMEEKEKEQVMKRLKALGYM